MKQAVRILLLLVTGIGFFGCAPKELPSVNLFITTDIEGVFWSRPEPRYGNEVTGGLSILKSFLDRQTTPFLLLEGGNWFAQTPEGTLSQGGYFNQAARAIPYSGRLFTEKDLAYGWRSLASIIKESPAPFVLSNVVLSNGRVPEGVRPWLLQEVGSYKIGVIGLVSAQSLKGKHRLGGLKILPEAETARKTIQLLKEKGAQVIVALAAMDTEEKKSSLTATELAEEVEGIDILVTSDLNHEDAEVRQLGRTLLVYPGSRLDSVGRVQLFFQKNGELAYSQFENVVLYKRDFGEDEEVALQIAELRRAARSQMSRPVGKTEQALIGKLDGESDLGNWAADCLRKWAKADAAVINASSLRDQLPEGVVTQYDLYKVYPYSDHVTYLTIKGNALKKALEEGLSVADNFAQISGMKVHYTQQAGIAKITTVQVGDKPLSPNATYRVAVTDHLLAGGAGHDGFIDSLEFKNTQVEMGTVLRLCLAGNKPVGKPTRGRWSMRP
ncbi:MAG: bifunctional metallophosphatase/5'-nucleotidase [Elusimicrobiaceae bacterium]|nr:bifunctional metallophosphatase/5'-nucleotidase [Elusimicrobiaceae bacterium]